MATAEAETSRDDEAPPGSLVYDGFISYSHAADDLLAPRLQSGLQRFAKPWWKRRALRIFRDESSLSANPHLWSSITDALDQSGWFVLLLSPEAAESPWVNDEAAYWLEHKDPGRIIPVLTDGDFGWAGGDITGDAVPSALQGAFSDEPRWVDMRFARAEEQLDLNNPEFSAAIADIASPIRGVPKDELLSEEVRQHRRTVRTAWAGGVGLAALALVAVIATIFALGQRNDALDNADLAEQNAAAEAVARQEADANAEEADANAQEAAANAEEAAENASLAEARELAASAINLLDEDPELSILLTLEAIAATPEGQDQPAEVIDALWKAVQGDRLEAVVETGYGDGTLVALSPDDTTLFVVNGFPVGGFPQDLVVQAYSTSSLEKLWEYEGVVGNILDPESEGDFLFLHLSVSPDGERLSLGLSGSLNRFLILDAADGSVVETILSDCGNVMAPFGWSPDGSSFVVIGGCESPMEVLDGETFELIGGVDLPDASTASFDASGRLFAFSRLGAVAVYEPPNYSQPTFLEGVRGLGDVSPDGSTVITFNTPTDPCLLFSPIPRPADCGTLAAFDSTTGEPTDLFTPLPAIPSDEALSFGFSGSDRLFAVPTQGAKTLVWDIETGNQVFNLPSGVGVNAAITSDGRRLFTGHQNGEFKVWDLSPNVGLDPVGDVGNYTLIGANSNVTGQTIGAFVATDPGTFESQILFFDLDTGALVGQPVVGQQPITPLADNRFLVTGSYAGGASAPSAWFVYDPMSGDRYRLAGCDVDSLTGLCDDGAFPIPYFWAPKQDGSQLVRFSFPPGQPLTLIDPNDGSVVGELSPASPFEFVGGFSDDMIGGSSQGQVLFEDLVTGEELARIADGGDRVESDAVTSVFYRVESIGLVDQTTWDIWFFPIDLGRVQGMAVDSELRRLALGDENGVHVYNLDSGDLLTSIPIVGVSDMHWISEDRVLVGTQTGAWATVSLLTGDLIDSARAGVTRTFTADECDTYRIDPCPTLEEIQGR